RIIQAIRRAGANNPVLMLDEVDKLGRDFRGDPAAALLEVLDPAQNSTFRDNYLNLPFDLSKVFFITTANTLDTVPRPLLDRMEILGLSGYSEEEKLEIARRYLIPRQREQTGLTVEQLTIPDDTVRQVISRYTREAGGEILYVEASLLPGRRVLRLTGQLGKVMRESAKTAQSFVWGHAEELGIDPDRFRSGVHVHVPAGAIPKDGPSAGVAMVTALASLLSGRPVRHTVGMTGEITLQGRVLPIGGLKQKALAAHAAGLTDVIIPERNRGDLDEI